jgi:hypothetical protein
VAAVLLLSGRQSPCTKTPCHAFSAFADQPIDDAAVLDQQRESL